MIRQVLSCLKRHRALCLIGLSFLVLFLAGALFIELAEDVLKGQGVYIDQVFEEWFVLLLI